MTRITYSQQQKKKTQACCVCPSACLYSFLPSHACMCAHNTNGECRERGIEQQHAASAAQTQRLPSDWRAVARSMEDRWRVSRGCAFLMQRAWKAAGVLRCFTFRNRWPNSLRVVRSNVESSLKHEFSAQPSMYLEFC